MAVALLGTISGGGYGQEATVHAGELAALGRCAAEVPPFACARTNGTRARHEPAEAGQARQPPPGAVEIAPARVHRTALRQTLRQGETGWRQDHRGNGSGEGCKEASEESGQGCEAHDARRGRRCSWRWTAHEKSPRSLKRHAKGPIGHKAA